MYRVRGAVWDQWYVCPMYRVLSVCPIDGVPVARAGKSGMSVLCIRCMLPMWGVMVSLSNV